MTKKFCDVCEEEITPENDARKKSFNNYDGMRHADIHVDVTIKTTGDFCKDCVMEAIKEVYPL